MIDMTGNRASPSQGISRHLLVGRVRRISSAEFFGMQLAQRFAVSPAHVRILARKYGGHPPLGFSDGNSYGCL